MRLFVLSWSFPPMPQPRAVQVGRMVAHMAADAVTVICSLPGKHASNGPPMPARPGLVVEHVSDAVPEAFLRLAERLWRGLGQRPDPQRGFAWLAARRLLRRHRVERDDTLITFGQPMSDHLAGLRVKQATGCRWIAHFSDPWVDNPFRRPDPASLAVNERQEAAVVAAADRLVFTSEETLDLFARRYREAIRDRGRVIPHAYDPALVPPRTARDGQLVVRHLGNFYGERSPLPVVEAARRLAAREPDFVRQVRFEFVGAMDNELKQWLAGQSMPDNVAFLPAVPYEASLALMSEADLLLLVEAPFEDSPFLPSKLVDYIAAGAPVLAVSPEGAAARVVRRLGGQVVRPDDAEAVADALRLALDEARTFRGRVWGEAAERARYALDRVAASMDALVRELEKDARE